MSPVALYHGDIIEILFVVVSFVPVLFSANAYRRRPEGRYFFLMLAFVFQTISHQSRRVRLRF